VPRCHKQHRGPEWARSELRGPLRRQLPPVESRAPSVSVSRDFSPAYRDRISLGGGGGGLNGMIQATAVDPRPYLVSWDWCRRPSAGRQRLTACLGWFDADRYSFIVSDFHRLLPAGLPAVGEGAGQPSSHEIRISGCRLCFESGRQHGQARYRERSFVVRDATSFHLSSEITCQNARRSSTRRGRDLAGRCINRERRAGVMTNTRSPDQPSQINPKRVAPYPIQPTGLPARANSTDVRKRAAQHIIAARPSPWGLSPPILCHLSWRTRRWVF
jgi:hypothetical protein